MLEISDATVVESFEANFMRNKSRIRTLLSLVFKISEVLNRRVIKNIGLYDCKYNFICILYTT